jgi:hypothetical protein
MPYARDSLLLERGTASSCNVSCHTGLWQICGRNGRPSIRRYGHSQSEPVNRQLDVRFGGTGCRCDDFGIMAGVPQIAADSLRGPGRQPWAQAVRKSARTKFIENSFLCFGLMPDTVSVASSRTPRSRRKFYQNKLEVFTQPGPAVDKRWRVHPSHHRTCSPGARTTPAIGPQSGALPQSPFLSIPSKSGSQ